MSPDAERAEVEAVACATWDRRYRTKWSEIDGRTSPTERSRADWRLVALAGIVALDAHRASIGAKAPETLEQRFDAFMRSAPSLDREGPISRNERMQIFMAGATASPPSPETLTDEMIEAELLKVRQHSGTIGSLKAAETLARWLRERMAGAKAQVPLPSRDAIAKTLIDAADRFRGRLVIDGKVTPEVCIFQSDAILALAREQK